jgi:hypothetical protein
MKAAQRSRLTLLALCSLIFASLPITSSLTLSSNLKRLNSELDHIDFGEDEGVVREGEEELQNKHMDGNEMDATDILAYSGQISDD